MKTIYLHTIAPELMCLGYEEEYGMWRLDNEEIHKITFF